MRREKKRAASGKEPIGCSGLQAHLSLYLLRLQASVCCSPSGISIPQPGMRACMCRFGCLALVRACREMSLVAVSRFFRFPIQMNLSACANVHQSPPQRAAG